MNPIGALSGKITKKTVVIAAAAGLGLAATGTGAYALLAPKDSTPVIAAADVRPIQVHDLEEKVQTNGDINPHRKTALSAPLAGPVKDLKVRAGDHVAADQIVAVMDTTAVQRQLELDSANKAAAAAAAESQLATAQHQYGQLQEQYQQQLSPEINSAVSAEQEAKAQLDAVARKFAHKQQDSAAHQDPALQEQEAALRAARDEQRDAGLNLARANAMTIYGVIMNESGTPDQPMDILGAEDRMRRAERELAKKQQAYQHSLVGVDRELAELQAQVADAHRAHAQAATAVESAKLATLHEMDSQRVAMEQAQQENAAAALPGEVSARHAGEDLAKAELRSPHSGVVTDVKAVTGAPAEGALLTIADDSKLIVKALVKEADIDRVQVGAEARFTTPATKDKQFSGRVVSVSPVAQTPPKVEGMEAQSANKKIEFPVEIAVTGDTKGLRLGGTAKADIVVKAQPHALVVPRSAVLKTGEGFHVVVLRKEDNTYRVVKTPVTVEAQSDFDAAISSVDLAEGDKVLSDPRKHEDKVGQVVRLEGAGA